MVEVEVQMVGLLNSTPLYKREDRHEFKDLWLNLGMNLGPDEVLNLLELVFGLLLSMEGYINFWHQGLYDLPGMNQPEFQGLSNQ